MSEFKKGDIVEIFCSTREDLNGQTRQILRDDGKYARFIILRDRVRLLSDNTEEKEEYEIDGRLYLLTKQQIEDFLHWDYDSGCCSCHINPPCSYCTHPGNPLSFEDFEIKNGITIVKNGKAAEPESYDNRPLSIQEQAYQDKQDALIAENQKLIDANREHQERQSTIIAGLVELPDIPKNGRW